MHSTFRAGAGIAVLAGLLACGGGGDGGTEPDPNEVASVAVSPSSASLNSIGATASFSAVARNSAGGTISGVTFNWTSEAGGVASVSGTGVATAVTNGSATIRATASGTNTSGTATVTVQQAVNALTVSPTTGTILAGSTLQVTPTATDPGGTAIASPALQWTTSNASVASVSNQGLVTGVASGVATITAANGAVSASAEVTVNNRTIVVGQDSAISGNVVVNELTIPANRTVTVTGPLTLAADGLITIAGTLIGSCVPFDISGDTAVVITGTVANGCDNGAPANLTIRSDGELEVDGATITSSGEITLSNDPDLDENDFFIIQARAAGPGPRATMVGAAQQGVKFTRVNNSTVKYQGNQGRGAGPNPAMPGTDGVTGTAGQDGRPVKMFLSGNAIFAGSTTLWGQDGGAGGNGVAPASQSDLTTMGGAGGNGGKMSIFITGTLTYQGTDNVVRAGRGGNGGNATAVTIENAANGPKGPNATAVAGPAGQPGIVDIRAGGGITIMPGALTVEMIPGDGGDANATGAKGADATASMPAQEGGDATATGGRGGHTPDARLTSSGVTGAPVIVADGGHGGTATATAGKGGNGLKPNKDGARGGTPQATGGNGGDARTRNQLNAIIGMGGNGGNAFHLGGNGGDGWNDCVAGMEEPGGAGGNGASIGTVTRGRGGSGAAPGTDGDNTYDTMGNGGNGGRGFNGGAAGRGGTGPQAPAQAIVLGDQVIPPSFQDGQPGANCPPPPPEEEILTDMRIDLPVQSGPVTPGSYLWALLDQLANVIGSVPVEAAGPPFNTFTAQNPTRVGWSMLGSWIFDVANAIVDGAPFEVTQFSICIINSDIDGDNPVFIDELDQDGKVVATTPVTTAAASIVQSVLADGPGCPDITLNSATKKVKVRGTGKGSGADGRGGKLRGKAKKK